MENKSYTKSELFTLANQIHRETKCTMSEAYHRAKNKLEMRGFTKERITKLYKKFRKETIKTNWYNPKILKKLAFYSYGFLNPHQVNFNKILLKKESN